MCGGRKGESWGLVWIILVGNTWKLVVYFNFFLNLGEERLLHQCFFLFPVWVVSEAAGILGVNT